MRRAYPALPRFISDTPVKPPPDADSDELERWAAWCLSNFTCYRKGTTPAAPYYPTFQRWDAQCGGNMSKKHTNTNEPIQPTPHAPNQQSTVPQDSDPLQIDSSSIKTLEDLWTLPGSEALAQRHLPELLPLSPALHRDVPEQDTQHAIDCTITNAPSIPCLSSLNHIAHYIMTNSNSRAQARQHCQQASQLRRQLHNLAKEVGGAFGDDDEPQPWHGDDDDLEDYDLQEEENPLPHITDCEPSSHMEDFEREVATLNNHLLRSSTVSALQCPSMDSLPATNPHNHNVVIPGTATNMAALTKIKDPALTITKANKHLQHNKAIEQTLRLERTTPSKVQAVLEVHTVGNAATSSPQVHYIPVGQSPAFVQLEEKPTITDTIRLFTLNLKQALALTVLADRMLSKLADEEQPQLLFLMLGDPGTGKSQVIKAFEWFAFQHGASHRIAVTSYTWRAALHVSNDVYPASSTSTFFGIDSVKGNKLQTSPNIRQRTQNNLTEVWFSLTDEISFVDQAHFVAMHRSCCAAMGDFKRPFGNLPCVGGVGDMQQLPPVAGSPQYAPKSRSISTSSITNGKGRDLWEQFQTVIMLTEQNRIQTDDEDGQKLLRFVKVFCNIDR